MTQTAQRPSKSQQPPSPPPHPHWTLGGVAIMGLVTALLAGAIATGALFVTAGRDSVDDSIVAETVDELLAEVGTTDTVSSGGAQAAPTEANTALPADVIPEFTPKAELAPAPASEINVSYAPAVPPASGRTSQAIVEVHFEVVEGVTAITPDGVEYETWGYRISGDDSATMGTPGPMIRARVGDVLRFTVTNPAGNQRPHNVDLHAVTGQGGGAADTTVAPGETKTIEARLLYPGIFMYHCAFGDVPAHIAHGMVGGILVDPAEPLPAVDQELYVVQSEYYTSSTDPGLVETDRTAMTDENPSFVVFNGAVGALTGDNAPTMQVGEKMRIYFINGGLNLISSFHAIGSHWDAVYPEGALLNAPLRGSQTTLVPTGSGVAVELIGQVPQTVLLVDHSLSRAFDKGALGQIVIEGQENPEIFEAMGAAEVGEDDDDAVPGDSGTTISMVPGAWEPQPMDAPDEFAEVEDPTDYSVNVLVVKQGTTVTWVNDDPEMIHTATAVDGSFDSGFMQTGDTWSYQFDEVGEFEYFCTPHPWMRAKVIVEP